MPTPADAPGPQTSDTQGRPDAVLPPRLLVDPAFRAACANRDIGTLFRLARKYAGLSPTRIGFLCELNPTRVGEYINGKREARSHDVLTRIADGLRIPGELLGLAPRSWQVSTASAAVTHSQAAQGPAVPDSSPDDAVPQRVSALVENATADAAAIIAGSAPRLDPVLIEQAQADTARLSVEYLRTPPAVILPQAQDVRRRVMAALGHTRRPSEAADLYLLGGLLSGILSYACLDLGYPDQAHTHARAGLLCADLAGHDGLTAWLYGTRSLISRFEGRYDVAMDMIHRGYRHAGSGTSLARLRSGEAQCLANLGDGENARRTLVHATAALQASDPKADVMDGLFTFSEAKQSYYAGSSMIWLTDPADAHTAEDASVEAIRLFRTGPTEARSLADEALAHVYLGTARVNLGEVEGAAEALRPVLDLPPEQRVSWHNKRLAHVAGLLTKNGYRQAPAGQDLYDDIIEYQTGSPGND